MVLILKMLCVEEKWDRDELIGCKEIKKERGGDELGLVGGRCVYRV